MEPSPDTNKILVPVDYSDCSALAGRYAAKIAHVTRQDILFFHTFYSPAYDLIELTGNKSSQDKLRAEVTQKLMVSEKEKMDEFIHSLLKHEEFRKIKPARIHTLIAPGIAKDEIGNLAQKLQPNLVIMGTHGKDKRENSILGSITEIMIKKLRFPIIAIPDEYKFIGLRNIKNLLFLTDYDESDFVSIKKLIEFTDPLGLKIHCLHIGSKPDNWEQMKMNGLKAYFKSSYGKVTVECDVLSQKGNLLEAIDEYVQQKNINIISLTTKKRSVIEKVFRPSVAKRLFYHTSIPLLVFHA
jgi:nucleotide-binding universal stress UspA family protein